MKPVPKSDADVFAEAMKDVKPLPPHNLAQSSVPSGSDRLKKNQYMSEPDTYEGDSARFTRSGIQKGVLRKLQNGQILIEAEIDLHGHTVMEAEQAIQDFLRQVPAGRQYAVRIIHGKG